MCGLSGFLAADPTCPGDLQAVKRMNAAQVHRGPDAEGLWSQGPAVLGHRRLSIIDLRPEGTQPLLNEDETLAIVVNGEIYNFQELRKELLAKGHRFRSDSDSETVLHLYEEEGPACIARLHGMFALALWDSKEQQLLVARDRTGKKPLHFRFLPEGIAFASEVQSLVRAFPHHRPEADLSVIDEYLALQYVPAPHCAFRGIVKLMPAHYAVLKPGDRELRSVCYWQKPQATPLNGSDAELEEELRRLLSAAVGRRMVADVPLGAFLSGGLDSSTIVALMAAQSSQPIKTFSIGFPNAGDDETPFARMVAKRYGTHHEELIVSPNMTDVVGKIVGHHGEPFGDSSAIATYYLAEMTRRHVTVALSGDAGDELFAGYRRYGTARIGYWHDSWPAPLRPVFRAGLGAMSGIFGAFVGRYAKQLDVGEAERYYALLTRFHDSQKSELYAPALAAARTNRSVERFAQLLATSRASSPIGRVADADFHTYLPDDINAKVDIASMAHALEVRCPFLDTEVIEFAARLPGRLLMRARGKYLLRRAMRDLVPAPILSRRKRGFALPLERWMRTDLNPLIRDVLLDQRARERGLFNPSVVEKLVEGLSSTPSTHAKVWTLLMLELWYREFIDG